MRKYGYPQSFQYAFECTYDSFIALYQALESKEDPKNYLYAHEFEGLRGPFHFNEKGDIVGLKFIVNQIKGGKVMPYVDR